MKKIPIIIIQLTIIFFMVMYWPVEIEPANTDNITSSTRNDWGGDQSSYSAHCGNSIGWWEVTDNNTGITVWVFDGGCNI